MATEATIDTSALAAAKRKEFVRTTIELAGMLPVLFVICVLFSVLTPNFLHENNIVNVIRQASINIVLAAGMTFVILTGGIDLAVGSVLDSSLRNHRHNLLKITSNSITQHQGDRQCLGWRGQPYGRQLQVYSWVDGWRPVGDESDC